MMALEEKLVSLARTEPTLQAYFGSGPYRIFDRQLPQKYIENGPTLSIQRVSTAPRIYTQSGIINQSEPRIQFVVRALRTATTTDAPVTARAAKAAIIAWLCTVSFANTNNFDSPATAPPHSPNFVLNEWSGMDYALEPPAYVERFDVRSYNLEN